MLQALEFPRVKNLHGEKGEEAEERNKASTVQGEQNDVPSRVNGVYVHPKVAWPAAAALHIQEEFVWYGGVSDKRENSSRDCAEKRQLKEDETREEDAKKGERDMGYSGLSMHEVAGVLNGRSVNGKKTTFGGRSRVIDQHTSRE